MVQIFYMEIFFQSIPFYFNEVMIELLPFQIQIAYLLLNNIFKVINVFISLQVYTIVKKIYKNK